MIHAILLFKYIYIPPACRCHISIIIYSSSSGTSCNLSYLILIELPSVRTIELGYVHKYNTPYRQINSKTYRIRCDYDLRLTRQKHLKLSLSYLWRQASIYRTYFYSLLLKTRSHIQNLFFRKQYERIATRYICINIVRSVLKYKLCSSLMADNLIFLIIVIKNTAYYILNLRSHAKMYLIRLKPEYQIKPYMTSVRIIYHLHFVYHRNIIHLIRLHHLDSRSYASAVIGVILLLPGHHIAWHPCLHHFIINFKC